MTEITTAVLLNSLTEKEMGEHLPGVQTVEVDSVTGP